MMSSLYKYTSNFHKHNPVNLPSLKPSSQHGALTCVNSVCAHAPNCVFSSVDNAGKCNRCMDGVHFYSNI